MDYRHLLWKYINFVGQVEGVTFIDSWHRFLGTPFDFLVEEWNELEKLDVNEYPAENISSS